MLSAIPVEAADDAVDGRPFLSATDHLLEACSDTPDSQAQQRNDAHAEASPSRLVAHTKPFT